MIEFSNHNVISVDILRAIRVFRFNSLFVAHSTYLQLGLKALRQSQAAARHLLSFLFLIIFVWALIGVVAFRDVQHISKINDQISFKTAGKGLIVMIQMSTSAGWDGLYKTLLENDYNPFAIFVFFWSFLFICILIIVNLVLTIVVNFYLKAYEADTDVNKLPSADFDDFNNKWNAIAASDQPFFIKKTQLPIVLGRLNASSSLRPKTAPTEEYIQLLGIPVHNEQQLYRGEVLIALNKARLRQISNEQHK